MDTRLQAWQQVSLTAKPSFQPSNMQLLCPNMSLVMKKNVTSLRHLITIHMHFTCQDFIIATTQVEVRGQLWEWILSVHILCGFWVGNSGHLACTAIIFTGWGILPAHMCCFNPHLSETEFMMHFLSLKVLSRDHQAISFINTEHLKSHVEAPRRLGDVICLSAL